MRGFSTTSLLMRIVLAAVATLAIAASVCFVGATSISASRLVDALVGRSPLDETEWIILTQLRLPRTIAAMLVGGSLAAAGVGFQGLFRNPLAEPYVIGASSGASLGVAVVVIWGLQASLWSLGATALMAMIGSIGVVMLVLAIGGLGRTDSTTSLLLAGVVISSMAGAIVSALMFLFDQKAVVILSWLMGSLASSHWGSAAMVGVLGGMGTLSIFALARPLDAFALGDTASRSLGLDLRRFRWLIIAASSIATAGAVASSGVIGFVGLISPHIARSLVGTRHVHLIPMSVCIGASLMLLADAVARTIMAPAELPVGIVTAILGCPFFLWLLLRDRRGALMGATA
ncbi:FecCD family ABC transporter permease [Allorhodopirellula heiligendammensis]|uniref:Hemin transport system permease protein HmuU n=1 Tax=Allorhodopirellula heiligendammensis TaxID=2714739 RepID=A0A5C6BVP1_9BACT|nr:iron ABC transporter permease [Allorhodopirellula heiligendammensis]TWU15296.1 Hemin transport system permease protein HmuU [Allorhodopirellula heiligendammensis]